MKDFFRQVLAFLFILTCLFAFLLLVYSFGLKLLMVGLVVVFLYCIWQLAGMLIKP